MTIEDLLLSGLLTYVVHSTVLMACASLTTRWLHRDDLRLRRSLWRLALLGGLLTSMTQTGLGFEPLGGALRLTGATLESAAPAPASPTHALLALPSALPPAPRAEVRSTLVRTALGLWLAGVAFTALRLGRSYRRFKLGLADRREVIDAGLRARLRAVLDASGASLSVRLTCSDTLTVPIAFGLRQAEICVPARAIEALDADQQQALLAHELAHLVHHDPLWLALYNMASTLFFFQPLNWLARRRLLSLSESAADTWAVEKAADPLALAGCLTRVADWVRPAPFPVLANAMAAGRSDLAQRIERMLEQTSGRDGRRSALRGAVLIPLVLAAVAFIAPGISLADKADEPTPPTPPEVASVAEPPAPPTAPRVGVQPALAARRAPTAPPPRAAAAVPTAPSAPAAVAPAPPDAPEALEPPSADGFRSHAHAVDGKAEKEAAWRAAADLKAQADQLRLAAADQRNALKREAAATAARLRAESDELRHSADAHARAAGAEKSALEDARRQLEAQARQLAQDRDELMQERHRLDEEVQRLREERERLRREREKERGQS